MHITNLCNSITPVLYVSSAIGRSLFSTRIDFNYANSLFLNFLKPWTQNAAKHSELLSSRSPAVLIQARSSVLLHWLHWLPVEFRIKFKLACLTYSTSAPTYLHALLIPYIPPRCLRSSGTGLLAEPRCRTDMYSMSLLQRNGIDCHPLFVAQIHSLP